MAPSKTVNPYNTINPGEESITTGAAKSTGTLSIGAKVAIGIGVVVVVAAAIGVPLGITLSNNNSETVTLTTTEEPAKTEIIVVTETTTPDPRTVPILVEYEFEPGCVIMIGSCATKSCEKENDINMCSEIDRSETISKVCNGKTHSVTSALSCKCEACEDQVITKTIRGSVKSKNGTAIENATICIDKVEKDRTDGEGMYNIDYNITDFDNSEQEVEITIKPPAGSGLMSTVKKVDVSGQNLVFEKNIVLQAVEKVITFNPSEEQFVSLGKNDTEPFADMDIQANSITNANGEPITGQVSVSISTMDTSSDDDMEDTPDTFQSAAENETIYSVGMFNSQCETEDGDECEINNVTISISVPSNTSSAITDNMFTWEQNNGTWVIGPQMTVSNSSNARRRRRSTDAVLTAVMNVKNRIYNLDYYRQPYCYIRVKIFATPSLGSPLPDARVRSVYRSSNRWLSYKWNYASWWYSEDSTVCTQIPCDSSGPIKYSYLTALTDDGEELNAVDIAQLGFDAAQYGITKFKNMYIIELPNTLPSTSSEVLSGKYDWWSCQRSNGPFLAFYSNSVVNELNFIPFVEKYLPYRGYVYDPLFWWQNKYWNNPCFFSIGVYTTNTSTEQIQVDIESFGGNVESVAGQWIGTRLRNITLYSTFIVDGVTYKYGFDLVEYKCSGNIFGSGNEIDQTKLRFLHPDKCKLRSINSLLDNQLKQDEISFQDQDSDMSGSGEESGEDYYNFEIRAPRMSTQETMKQMGIYTNPYWGVYRYYTHWSLRYPKYSKTVTKERYESEPTQSEHKTYLEEFLNDTDVLAKVYLKDLFNETFIISVTNLSYANTFVNFTYLEEKLNTVTVEEMINGTTVELLVRADEIHGVIYNYSIMDFTSIAYFNGLINEAFAKDLLEKLLWTDFSKHVYLTDIINSNNLITIISNIDLTKAFNIPYLLNFIEDDSLASYINKEQLELILNTTNFENLINITHVLNWMSSTDLLSRIHKDDIATYFNTNNIDLLNIKFDSNIQNIINIDALLEFINGIYLKDFNNENYLYYFLKQATLDEYISAIYTSNMSSESVIQQILETTLIKDFLNITYITQDLMSLITVEDLVYKSYLQHFINQLYMDAFVKNTPIANLLNSEFLKEFLSEGYKEMLDDTGISTKPNPFAFIFSC